LEGVVTEGGARGGRNTGGGGVHRDKSAGTWQAIIVFHKLGKPEALSCSML
jgi:hypothetical protein